MKRKADQQPIVDRWREDIEWLAAPSPDADAAFDRSSYLKILKVIERGMRDGTRNPPFPNFNPMARYALAFLLETQKCLHGWPGLDTSGRIWVDPTDEERRLGARGRAAISALLFNPWAKPVGRPKRSITKDTLERIRAERLPLQRQIQVIRLQTEGDAGTRQQQLVGLAATFLRESVTTIRSDWRRVGISWDAPPHVIADALLGWKYQCNRFAIGPQLRRGKSTR